MQDYFTAVKSVYKNMILGYGHRIRIQILFAERERWHKFSGSKDYVLLTTVGANKIYIKKTFFFV